MCTCQSNYIYYKCNINNIIIDSASSTHSQYIGHERLYIVNQRIAVILHGKRVTHHPPNGTVSTFKIQKYNKVECKYCLIMIPDTSTFSTGSIRNVSTYSSEFFGDAHVLSPSPHPFWFVYSRGYPYNKICIRVAMSTSSNKCIKGVPPGIIK